MPHPGHPITHSVNRAFYVMQSEFYPEGAFQEQGLQAFDMDKALVVP